MQKERIKDDQDWVWSIHSLKKGAERYPGADLPYEISKAVKPTKRQRNLIRTKFSHNSSLYLVSQFNGRYYLVSGAGLIFVVQAPNIVITVLDIRDNIPGFRPIKMKDERCTSDQD